MPQFGGGLFCQWRCVRTESQLIMDEVYARPSIPLDFHNISKKSQYSWRLLAPLERCARDKLENTIPDECAQAYAFTDFATTTRYVLLSPTWSSTEVPTGRAAFLPACVSYLRSRLWDDANHGLWVLVYID